jgi:quinol monooxygenase YgiN
MYVRFLQLRAKSEYLAEIKGFYDQIVIPELQKIPGCHFACLIQSGNDPDDFVSLTFWDTKKEAEKYDKSEIYKRLLSEIKPFLAESSEWKIQLSDQLELNYEPVAEEPVLKEFAISAKSNAHMSDDEEKSRIYLRLVSARIREGKMDEFTKLYDKIIIPALKNTKGCLYAYLSESIQEKNQIISITIWESQEDADMYEKSGRFAELTEKVKHTLSELYQWKMALEKGSGRSAKTSDDLEVSRYSVVSRKKFSPKSQIF